MFNPVVFQRSWHQLELPLEPLLPMTFDKTPLGGHEDGEVVAYKVSIYPCCAGKFKYMLKSNDYVMKMLSEDLDVLWENELNSYNKIKNESDPKLDTGSAQSERFGRLPSPFNYLLKCLGSFRWVPNRSNSDQHPQAQLKGTSDGPAKHVTRGENACDHARIRRRGRYGQVLSPEF